MYEGSELSVLFVPLQLQVSDVLGRGGWGEMRERGY